MNIWEKAAFESSMYCLCTKPITSISQPRFDDTASDWLSQFQSSFSTTPMPASFGWHVLSSICLPLEVFLNLTFRRPPYKLFPPLFVHVILAMVFLAKQVPRWCRRPCLSIYHVYVYPNWSAYFLKMVEHLCVPQFCGLFTSLFLLLLLYRWAFIFNSVTCGPPSRQG